MITHWIFSSGWSFGLTHSVAPSCVGGGRDRGGSGVVADVQSAPHTKRHAERTMLNMHKTYAFAYALMNNAHVHTQAKYIKFACVCTRLYLGGDLKLGRVHVDADDTGGTGDLGRLDHCEPDGPEAEDCDGRAWLDLGVVPNRAPACAAVWGVSPRA